MGVKCPSVESSDLTTARKIIPHAALAKGEKVGRVGDQGEDARGKKKRKNYGKYRVTDSGEEGE
jgi:hypothetical protein